MNDKANNYAYIDGANLHKGINSLGWQLDYARFRVWLTEKYKVEKAYLFIGLIPSYKDLYKYLQESGFILVYKEVVYDDSGKPKGNCDADKCSILLKRTEVKISYLNEQRSILEAQKEKAPDGDETP